MLPKVDGTRHNDMTSGIVEASHFTINIIVVINHSALLFMYRSLILETDMIVDC